jgi:SAM-dependent methyltransferase
MRTDFERERWWWDAKASREERDRADEAINRALRWREIERHLDGMRTVLDVGGGTGAFSIPLARRGLEVTHVDFSPAMLDIARQRAGDLPNLRTVEANAVDLSLFADRSLDLVLNTDGAISFSGSEAGRAIDESCRVTGGTLILTVSNRAQLAAVWAAQSLSTLGRLCPAVQAMFARGEWHQDAYPENALLSRGATQDYMGALKAYLPCELRAILESRGLRVVRCGGLGSLAGLVGPEAVARALRDEDLFEAFLDLCETYDRDILPEGPGTRQRAGLIAVAVRIEESGPSGL